MIFRLKIEYFIIKIGYLYVLYYIFKKEILNSLMLFIKIIYFLLKYSYFYISFIYHLINIFTSFN